MKKLIGILVFIFFVSCASNPPKWYEKIYTDNSYFIYSTGAGKTKQEAINTALANASSKVAVIVRSTYNSLKYSYKGNDTSAYSNTSVFDIQTKTNPLTFTDYKILKLEKKDKYYVLLKINRYKNAKFMCDNTEIENIDTENLNILFNYKRIINQLNKKIEKLKNINALYPLCKDKLKNALLLKQKIEKKYHNLSLNIISNDERLKEIIESALNIKSSNNAKIQIYANSKTTFKSVGNYKISIIKLNIKIKSQNKSRNLSVECAGSSIQDYSVAKSLAYKVCEEKIKRIFNN